MSFSGNGLERSWKTIVGVVKEIKERGYDLAPKPVTYVPVRQADGYFTNELIVRAQQGSPEHFLNAIRQAVQSVDPDQPVGLTRTFDQILALDQASRRQQMFLLAAFSGLSLIMACLGIYAILAYTVELRRQEIGVRMALGARGIDVMRLVAGHGLKLAASGALLGIGIALAGARVLSASLYQVKPFDPATLVGVCAVLLAVALLACWIPARRAAGTEPVVALRW
jgi:predicted lysophospholipase L1 biosynthesis ABC-type transport system permease subunit